MQKNSRHHLLVERSIDTGKTIIQKVTVKTRPANWQGTDQPVILPFSIYSALYEGIAGDFKVASFLQVVKSNVKGKITILLCEGAHLQTLSLQHNSAEKALQICCQEADFLVKRYNLEFQNCEVIRWKDFVTDDSFYKFFKDKIYHLYQINGSFQSKVRFDAEKTSNVDFNNESLDKPSYVNKAELDLLEQCIYLMIASKKGYRFEFYPGKRNNCVDFINCKLLDDFTKLTRINITLGSPKNFENVEENLIGNIVPPHS